MSLPAASCHLTYPGDVRHMVGETKGQNALGEWLTAVSADYDPETGKTRVGFAIGIHSDQTQRRALENRSRWMTFLHALGAVR